MGGRALQIQPITAGEDSGVGVEAGPAASPTPRGKRAGPPRESRRLAGGDEVNGAAGLWARHAEPPPQLEGAGPEGWRCTEGRGGPLEPRRLSFTDRKARGRGAQEQPPATPPPQPSLRRVAYPKGFSGPRAAPEERGSLPQARSRKAQGTADCSRKMVLSPGTPCPETGKEKWGL
ncbi:basic salivary proline-rich protein 2-like [Manis pentadactyla]|uniref:basic salivary proline-rich protein 2-like n=1 Tax=Manis pentadactyla TaxID=143292 RepID=UPI00255C3210|nr:basic salivary proline-rich protein 2-like [Manis pentadactyla]